MSSEEKNEKIEETVEKPVEKQKPVVDYSKKSFYELINLKNDASEETIKSTYAELSKKYNPVTNPDEISKYQDVVKAGEVLSDPVSKRFYDEYGDLSILIYDILRIYLPMKDIERPSSYIYAALFGISGICIINFVAAMVVLSRATETYVFNWYLAFIPTLILSFGYLIYVICRTLTDISDAKSKTDKKESEELKKAVIRSNGITIAKTILSILFQFALGCHLKNQSKCAFVVTSIIYFAFEGLSLFRDTVKFKKVTEAIKNGKDVDCPILKKNIYIKYLIGKSNVKDKDDKKSSYLGYLILYLYNEDVIRIIQNVLIGISYLIKPSNYTIFYLPVFVQAIVGIAQGILQSKIGYKKGTTETVNDVFRNTVYILLALDTIVLLQSLNYNAIKLTSQSFPFLIENALLVGFLLGVLPFVLIMEFKIKHDVTDVPY